MEGKSSPYRYLMYVLGRSITYTMLGWILMCLIGGGRNINGVQMLLSKGETILPFVLVAMGLFMLYRGLFHHHHEHGDDCHNSGTIIKRNGPLGTLILGLTLALAFCPESAVFYFGVMIPLSMSSQMGLFIPLLFAVGAAVPVLALALVLGKAAGKLKGITHMLEHFQQWLNIIAGIVFLVIAVMVWID